MGYGEAPGKEVWGGGVRGVGRGVGGYRTQNQVGTPMPLPQGVCFGGAGRAKPSVVEGGLGGGFAPFSFPAVCNLLAPRTGRSIDEHNLADSGAVF